MPQMILRSSPASPFGRKVKLVAAACGLTHHIDIVRADTNDPEDDLRSQNPLGKIPTLLLSSGEILYDSRVIVEYLDHRAGGDTVIPADPDRRFKALTLQALGDGIMDAALLRRYELVMRDPSERSARWDEHQSGKIERALDHLSRNLPSETNPMIGEITIACALGYLDFRFDARWRVQYPRLEAWLTQVSGRIAGWDSTRPS